jgi:uncharacterized protein YebE (UPF0316 family)
MIQARSMYLSCNNSLINKINLIPLKLLIHNSKQLENITTYCGYVVRTISLKKIEYRLFNKNHEEDPRVEKFFNLQ